MVECINNKIQQYIESSLKYLDKWHKVKINENEDNLYDMYKDIRVEYASCGMISVGEKNMINPKSIAMGLVYLWSFNNDLGITQRDVSESFMSSESSIHNSYKLLKKFFEEKR